MEKSQHWNLYENKTLTIPSFASGILWLWKLKHKSTDKDWINAFERKALKTSIACFLERQEEPMSDRKLKQTFVYYKW